MSTGQAPPQSWGLGSAVSPGLISLQEENIRREKQLLLDAQRQAALEKEVCSPPCLSCPGPGVLRLCWPVSCYPVDLTFEPRGVELWWQTGAHGPQILETVASVALAFNPSRCFLFPTLLTLPAPHLLPRVCGRSYLFLCPRKPQPPISTWKKRRKSTPTWWSRSGSCEGSSMTCVSGGWSWSRRWICCRHKVRGCRST